ncbi:MAG: (2Fe-2S)-binding protein [Chloroflexota bacterium]
MSLNGVSTELDAEPTDLLLDVVRRAGCTGVKEGCWIGVCGACTVIVDGLPVSSCLYMAGCAAGADVWTVEGLTARDPRLVDAFAEAGAIQCGFCTPGQVTLAWWLANREAKRNGVPKATTDVDDVTDLMAGNLCRCTGYQAIRKAVDTYRAGH